MDHLLCGLSDAELINRLEDLVRSEREVTERVVRHLGEVEVRRLYAGLGYTSLFDYATRGLRYSASAAMRRIKAARAGSRAPKVYGYLESGELKLSTVELLSEVLDTEDLGGVVETLRGKSREEAERVISRLRPLPPSAVRDRIEPVVVGTQGDIRQEELSFKAESDSDENSSYYRSVVEERYRITFSASADFMEQLSRVKELMFRGEREDVLLENIFGEALSLYIAKHCPQARRKRRVEREAAAARKSVHGDGGGESEQGHTFGSVERVQEAQLQPDAGIEPVIEREPGIKERKRSGGRTCRANPSVPAECSRRIPAALRDAVMARDEWQCTFESSGGVRCCATWDLEVDHVRPFALGGETCLGNLRVLCRAHNLAVACAAFGSDLVERCIRQRTAHVGQRGG